MAFLGESVKFIGWMLQKSQEFERILWIFGKIPQDLLGFRGNFTNSKTKSDRYRYR